MTVDVRTQLPTFPPTAADQARAARAVIRIDGLVATPQVLDEPFVCEEGWIVPGLRWRGVRLSTVLALARPLPTARYVRAGSGAWVVPIAMADSVNGLVCDELNGEPLTLERGAPWRLVLSGGACYTNVKWLDHLEVVADPGEDTARRIALDRMR